MFTARYKPVIFEISWQTGANMLTTLFTLKFEFFSYSKTQISQQLFHQNWQISKWKIQVYIAE